MTNVINATPMHDIGKISTPDYFLQKPGKLTADEYEIMKKHAAQGGEIIKRTFANIDDSDYQKITYEVLPVTTMKNGMVKATQME